MTLKDAAIFFGFSAATTYHRYERGERDLSALVAQTILTKTTGEVSLTDLHATRLEFLKNCHGQTGMPPAENHGEHA